MEKIVQQSDMHPMQSSGRIRVLSRIRVAGPAKLLHGESGAGGARTHLARLSQMLMQSYRGCGKCAF